MNLRAAVLGAAAAGALAPPCAAQPCRPYWTLAGAQIVTYGMVTFDDGSGPAVYNAGYYWWPPIPGNRFPVHRWRGSQWEQIADGVPDGVVQASQSVRVLDDGSGPRLYLTGLLPGYTTWFIRRWNGAAWEPANPLLWSGDPGGGVARISYDDGSGPAIYGMAAPNRIVRWTGSAWQTIGEVYPANVHMFEVFDDGTGAALYINGDFISVSGVQARDIARWDGHQWSAVGGGIVIREARDMCVYNGALYVADMTMGGGQPINRLGRWDGTSWSNVGAGFTVTGFLELYSMEVFDDGTGPALFVAGLFEDAGGVPARNLAKWDGQRWHAVPPGIGYIVSSMAVYDDGRGESLFLGGDFVSAGGGIGNGLVQYVGCKTGNCYADCNRDGALTLADFTCFQQKYASMDPYANCNKDAFGPPAGVYGINLADFGCFATKFAMGCP